MIDIVDRLKACVEEVKTWSEWPDCGDLPCMVDAIAEIKRLRAELDQVRAILRDREGEITFLKSDRA